MVCFTVLYPATAGSRFDWVYYLDKHLALSRRLLTPRGLVRIEIDRGLAAFPPGSPAPFHAIARLFFRTQAELEGALAATAADLIADVPKYTDVQALTQIGEITES